MKRVLKGRRAGPMIGVAVAVGVALWVVLRPSDRIPSEIVAAAAPSVGRVNVIDMQGKAAPMANAFAIDKGVMVTLCEGFRANSHVVVRLAERMASGTVSARNEKRNLCRLAVADAGSWPLGVSNDPPQSGDVAYAASTNPAGETQFVKVKVRGVVAAEGVQWIEISQRVAPEQAGGPLLDAGGRVIGVLAPQQVSGKPVAMPAAWVRELRAAPTR